MHIFTIGLSKCYRDLRKNYPVERDYLFFCKFTYNAFVVMCKHSQFIENILIMTNPWASDLIVRKKKIRGEKERKRGPNGFFL